jgi:uncharacterized membrane protein
MPENKKSLKDSVYLVTTIGGGHGQAPIELVGCYYEKTEKLEADASKHWWSIKEFKVEHYL